MDRQVIHMCRYILSALTIFAALLVACSPNDTSEFGPMDETSDIDNTTMMVDTTSNTGSPTDTMDMTPLDTMVVDTMSMDTMDIDTMDMDTMQMDTMDVVPVDEEYIQLSADSQAVVTEVTYSGSEGSYQFSVGLKSPDTGCDQYADWWEIISPDTTIVYRRILTHSHINEQPFVRTGGPVDLSNDSFVYIRGHMNNLQYGSLIYSGSINSGFNLDTIPADLFSFLAEEEPLPGRCDN